MSDTQTIVIGQLNKISVKPNPITFELHLNQSFVAQTAGVIPRAYRFIELICKNYNMKSDKAELDLMLAYNLPSNREEEILYIGKWNDGVVE